MRIDHTVIDAPPLPTVPTGSPRLIFRLPGLPSVNDVLYLAPKARAGAIKAERSAAYTSVVAWASMLKLPLVTRRYGRRNILQLKDAYIKGGVFCFASVTYRAGELDPSRGDRRRDVYNLLVKALIDGCTDALLWVDDSAEYHTDFWVHYAGVSPRPEVEIRVYESPYENLP